ncbi:MAG TPA: hypothetical protein VGD60_03110 [Candidatus Acidoferrales bacterium]
MTKHVQGLAKYLAAVTLAAFIIAAPAHCKATMAQAVAAMTAAPRDGAHDFDFAVGKWKTHISRLDHPLTGSTTWTTMTGDVSTRKVWDGRAALEEIEADGGGRHFEGLTLFLYNPQARQWSLNFTNSSEGTMSTPAIGEFSNGRGEFYDQEPYNGRSILVRCVWSGITANSYHFEQSFSADGGKTWEPNFTADLTRVQQ